MASVWDTTILSRCLASEERMGHVMRRAADGDAVRVAAPAVLEVAYGLELAELGGGRVRRHLRLLDRCVSNGLLRVVSFDARAAVVAGRLRAHAPHAPAASRSDRRSKAMRQAAWLLDIQIASTAFAGGLDLATENLVDFERIAGLLVELFPTASALRVAVEPA